jgi:hypothetical protein
MRYLGGQLRLAATDLSNHLACRHVTQLDLQVVREERSAPDWAAPDLKVIQELGKRHEAAYLKHLEDERKFQVVRLPERWRLCDCAGGTTGLAVVCAAGRAA